MKLNNFPVTDGDIHRKILVVDTHDNIFTGNFYSKETHGEDCCALEWHNDGFEGASFYPTKYLKGWMEFPDFNNEIKKQFFFVYFSTKGGYFEFFICRN